MSSDLLANLHLDSKFNCNIIAVKEINNCDGSFIISCLLSNWIKNKNAVLIVSTHHSLQHYQYVGLKMNYNLQKCVDSGLVTFFNLGEELISRLMKSKVISLDHQLSKLKEKVQQLHNTYSTINIIFDGLTHLFDLNLTLQNINKFCNDVIKVGQSLDSSSILFHCNVASEDDVSATLANLLTHKASTVLEVEHLQSGLSVDVSGHLVVKCPQRKFQDDYMFMLEQRPSKYLFKLFDRGVKLFAPGTV